ncbi:venom acid phosphatase Acph-1-like [Diachasmimorpha longicaudata]|uniref:venom acid phosphatase Acph-1-like n=1 Tax=Diachasmimorpha longicaudata TaxID=58733 RepID=UPI0030B8B5C1
MKFNYGLTIFSFILYSKFCDAELLIAQVLIRHTQATPIATDSIREYFPKIRENNVSMVPGTNQLTIDGQQKALQLGAYFRRRYGFNDSFDKIYFRSQKTTTAWDTAELMALGLLTECYTRDHNCLDAMHQPNLDLLNSIPYYRMDFDVRDEDMLFSGSLNCTNYQQKFNSLISAQTKRMSNEMRKIYDYLSLNTGTEFNTCTQGWLLHQYLQTEANVGIPSANWTKNIFPNGALKNLTILKYLTDSATPQMRRLLGGAHISTFLHNVDNYVKGWENRRLLMYVADDYHIAGLLNALNVYDGKHVPDYGSYIALELHKVQDKLFVMLAYNNGTIKPDFTLYLPIPGCTDVCPLADFEKNFKSNTLRNFGKDCCNSTENKCN